MALERDREAMTTRWMVYGLASALALGLVAVLVVSGSAFMDRLDSDGQERVTIALPPPGDGAQEPIVLPEPAAPARTARIEEADPVSASPPEVSLEGTPPNASPRSGETAQSAGSGHTTDIAQPAEIRFEVRRGDSLYAIFKKRGLSQQELHGIVSSSTRAKERLSKLRPGDELRLRVDGTGSVLALSHVRDTARVLVVEQQGDEGYAAHWDTSQTPAPSTQAPPPKETQAPGGLAADAAGQTWAKREIRVASGDSLYTIFIAEDLSIAELVDLLRSGDHAQALRRLLPGQKLDIYLDAQGSVRRLVSHRDEFESLHFFRDENGFSSRHLRIEPDRRLSSAGGEIRDSFYLAAQRAGLSDRLIMETAEIFGWDIDFALDIRVGDRFTVVYEENHQPDGGVSDGDILAAEFVNRGHTVRALRYEDDNGRARYYTPGGLSMRKAFLRAPVHFTRISSRFGLRRHPVLHKLRHHNGVDYAAPRGTPVRTTGDGKVAFIGRKGGYGKTVVVRHGTLYTTLYGHLSRYAKGLKQGHSVRQGQVIAYVGTTGLSTGPHLHYEFRVRDRHRDPLKVELPEAEPIAQEHKADFLARTRSLVARLESLSRTQLAAMD